jgi:hypothetical protein
LICWLLPVFSLDAGILPYPHLQRLTHKSCL